MPNSQQISRYNPRQWLRALLLLDDTPHSVALGAAIGMFIAMTPTVGIQMMIVVAVAAVTWRLFYFNRTAALIAVYVSNPITLLPIYWLDYKVGTLLFEETVTKDQLREQLQARGGGNLREEATGLFTRVWDLIVEVGPPLVAGSLAVGLVCALLTYPAILWLVRSVRGEQPSAAAPSDAPGTSDRTSRVA